jgi:hypothetical protein
MQPGEGGGFLRPGSRTEAAFGFSFGARNDGDRGRDRGGGAGRGGHAHAAHAHGRPPMHQQAQAGPGSAGGAGGAPPEVPPGPGDHLPVARYRDSVLHLLEQHPTLVLLGETGSGKTTQARGRGCTRVHACM